MPVIVICFFIGWCWAIGWYAMQQEKEADHILRNLADREAWLRGYDKGLRDAPPTAVASIIRVADGLNLTALYAETFTGLRQRDRLPDEYVARGMAKDLAKEIIGRRAYLLKTLEDYPNDRLRYCMKIAIVTEEEAIDGIR